MPDDFVGQLIDRKYRLLSVLGRGGMGVVYRAEQLDADGHPFREVALKTLLPHVSADSDFARRFLQEVRVTAQLDSLHAVAVHDCGRDGDGQLYYTMELVRGQTLKEVLQEQGNLAVERAIGIASQICTVLAEAHGLPDPVVHRDLKPANIFIEQRQGQERVKIGDFGIAKVLSEHTTGLTQTGQASLGTPRYMAPEQWLGEAADGRTDLYALGVMLYEMLTGYPPFTGEDGLQALMMQHVHKPPPPLPASIAPGLRILVEQLLAKLPQERPPDALSVRRALETALDKEEERPTVVLPRADAATAEPTSPPKVPTPPPLPQRSWRRTILAVAASVSFAVLVALSLWAYSQRQQVEAERKWQVQLRREKAARQTEMQQQAAEAAKRQVEAAAEAKPKAEAEEARRQAEVAEVKRQAEAIEAKRKAGEEAKKQMVAIPTGEFFMGCNEAVDKECDDNEKPGRRVPVAAFSIDKTEVTVAQYARCVAAGKCSEEGLTMPHGAGGDDKEHPGRAWACNWEKAGREQHPINCVDWDQAKTYCEWAGKRLPTEAEWEKAARGTDGRKYPWGNRGYGEAGRVANIADETAKRNQPNLTVAEGYDDGFYETAPVGSFPAGASPYGALDMIGNVGEWTADWYDKERKGRAVRGGSWRSPPRDARAAVRHRGASGSRRILIGFRCAQ